MTRTYYLSSIFFLLWISCLSALGQESAYDRAMLERVTKLESTSLEEFASLAQDFDRFATLEGADWHASYYAAYCRAIIAIADKAQADSLSAIALPHLERAQRLGGDRSELACLHSLLAMARMSVSPEERWQTDGVQSISYLQTALQANPNNPRAYFLQAQSVAHTPTSFGGGREKALPLVRRAIELFSAEQRTKAYSPHWGLAQAENLLRYCTRAGSLSASRD